MEDWRLVKSRGKIINRLAHRRKLSDRPVETRLAGMAKYCQQKKHPWKEKTGR